MGADDDDACACACVRVCVTLDNQVNQTNREQLAAKVSVLPHANALGAKVCNKCHIKIARVTLFYTNVMYVCECERVC